MGDHSTATSAVLAVSLLGDYNQQGGVDAPNMLIGETLPKGAPLAADAPERSDYPGDLRCVQ